MKCGAPKNKARTSSLDRPLVGLATGLGSLVGLGLVVATSCSGVAITVGGVAPWTLSWLFLRDKRWNSDDRTS